MMPHTRSCLTPHEFLDRISGRLREDVDMSKIKRCRSWIQNDLAPRLNRRGGRGVSEDEIERLIGMFSYIVFWNQLPTTRFRWVKGLVSRDSAYGTTNSGGTVIEMDPDKNKRGCRMADNLLSTLLHECCHAILEQQACRGQCGRSGCLSAWDKQVESDRGHGPAWKRLARGAENIANMHDLFEADL